jgi:hypothetical protein
MVDRIVAAAAISRLLTVASAIAEFCSISEYQRSENPSHAAKRELLTLNTASTSSGRCRKP